MIIINVTGQFGNQMFQYALGRHFQQQGHKVLYYTEYYIHHPEYDFALPRVFSLSLREATKNQVLTCRDDRHRFIDRVRRKIWGRHQYVYSEIGTGSLAYKPEVFDFKHGFIDGYWQSEKYFLPIADIIRKEFTFPTPSERNRIMANKMSESESVSIHFRRYINYPVQEERYYYSAMAYFTERFENVHFFVFSDDIDWCRSHLKAENISYIDWNTGENSPFDMWLMTQCRHNIIANSSFSWWGAWLNQNARKEVIAPKLWFHHEETPDVYCKNWIII